MSAEKKGVEIRENYEFTIRGTHILSEPHIEITPRPGNTPVLRKGALVEGVNPVPIESLVERGNEIAEQLTAILERIRSGVDDEETIQDVKGLIKNLSSLSAALSTSLDGSEQDVRSCIRNIESSSASLDAILNNVENGQGTLGKLLVEDELYEDMRGFVKDIRAHPWKLMKKDSGDRKRFIFF